MKAKYKHTPELESLLEMVSRETNVPQKDIVGRCRDREIAIARHLYSYCACIVLPHLTKSKIASLLGQDHSTVIHSREYITREIRHNDELNWAVRSIIESEREKMKGKTINHRFDFLSERIRRDTQELNSLIKPIK